MAIKKRFDLDSQEAAVIKLLETANAAKLELLAELATGSDVTTELTAINGEIAEHEQKLTTFREARAARQAANSEGARRSRHEKNVAKVKSAHEKGKHLAKLSAEAIKHIGLLGKQLEEIAAVRNAFVVDLRDVLLSTRECEAGKVSQRQVTDGHEIVFNVANTLTLPTYFQAALRNAGVGTKGIHAPGVTIDRLSPPDQALNSTYTDPTEAIASALANLDGVIRRVADVSERANGAKAA